MKSNAILITLVLIGFAVHAQQPETNEIQTIFKDKTIHGGYGGFSIGYTKIDGYEGMALGGRGLWIINHALGIGAGGTGFFSEAHVNNVLDPTNIEMYRYAGGYGGLILEPIIFGKFPVHLSFPVLIGAGGIVYGKDYRQYEKDTYFEPYNEDVDAFFIIEPGVEVELNMVKTFRLCFGVYHRFTSSIILETQTSPTEGLIKEYGLNDLTFGMTLKFGKF